MAMQIQDRDKFPKFDHRALPPACGGSVNVSALADHPGHAVDGRSSRKLEFQTPQVGRIAPQ